MKKAPFIVVLTLLVISLTGCANSNANVSEILTHLETLEKQVATLDEKVTSLQTEIRTAKATPITEEEDFSSSISSVPISSISPSIPQIALKDENIKANVIFCGQSFEVDSYEESSRERASSNALNLPYYGKEVRNCSLVVSGISINAIYYIENGSWKQIENINFDNIDNTYLAELYINGDDVNIFMLQTVNGSHYYIGIKE